MSTVFFTKKVFKLAISLVWFLGLSLVFVPVSADSTFTVGFYFDGDTQFGRIRKLAKKFESLHPDIKIKMQFERDTYEYNKTVRRWLEEPGGPEIIYWYGGQRLNQFVDEGLVKDLSFLWNALQLKKAFPTPLIGASQVDKRFYGIPLTYFYWALVYYEPVLQELGVEPPKTWKEMLDTCKVLRERGVDLLSSSSKVAWVNHGLFDYLNLRISGLDFYRELLAGRVPFTHRRVTLALEYWKELLDNQCFNENHYAYDQWGAFPRIVHGMSAMILIDGAAPDTPKSVREKLRMAPFPEIVPGIPQYTVAPVNLLIVPEHVDDSPELYKALEFAASTEVQSAINKVIRRPPAHRQAKILDEHIMHQMQKSLNSSPGGIQYLDRDTDMRFAEHVPEILKSFMDHRDVERTAYELEQVRASVFGSLETVSSAPGTKPKKTPTTFTAEQNTALN